MSAVSSIEWTDRTWNPVRGCSRVSEGCRNCYAERMAARFTKPGQAYHGFATAIAPRDALDRVGGRRAGWTRKVELIPKALDEPLRWRKPQRVFVNSMSDLFHEGLSDEAIDRVFSVMAWVRRHTFQILTKRAARLRAYGQGLAALDPQQRSLRMVASMYRGHPAEGLVRGSKPVHVGDFPWPLPNVWLGVSVEDQATADERIPLLLQTPAAVRFVSYEPALGPVDFESFMAVLDGNGEPSGPRCNPDGSSALGWVIVGGESGPGARPFDVEWARSTVRQCKAAGVPVFVKQLGARPGAYDPFHQWFDGIDFHQGGRAPVRLKDRKGGDPAEWPEDLRVREFPEVAA